ncbi:MAG: CdaR family protein [Planctomycetia bacterium]|nr:CdaR family protein [Planctomycetia bacterium]
MQKNKTSGKSKISENRVFLAVLSLLIAFLLWVYYTNNYASSMTKTFYNVEVVYSGVDAMRDSQNLVISQMDTETVNVTLTGNRREISKLSSEDLNAVVNLYNVTRAGYRTMSYTMSYPTSVNSSGIKVTGQTPQTVGLYISKLSTKIVDVVGTFEGTVLDGYAVDSTHMSFDPATVTLVGPEEVLNRIDKAHVLVSREDVSSTFTVNANYTLIDTAGELVETEDADIQTDAENIVATVPISMKKDVALGVTLIDGGGALASENVIVDVKPSTITIAGDAATLEAINSLSVATIDLSDYTEYPTTEVNIVLPNGTDNLSGIAMATVSLTFTGLEWDLFNVTNLSYTGLEEGYTAKIITSSLVTTIRAPEGVLSQIEANNIRAVADLTGLTTTTRAPVTFYVDGFEQAGAVGDITMYVEITPEDGE